MAKLNWQKATRKDVGYAGVSKSPMSEAGLKLIDNLLPILISKQKEPVLKIVFGIRKQITKSGFLTQKQFSLLEKFRDQLS